MQNNNNQHIKNFFNFLKEKDDKNIPFEVKFTTFPHMITNKDVEILKYDFDPFIRANIFNRIKKREERFIVVQTFGMVSPSLALAYSNIGWLFIDIEGNISVKDIDFSVFKETTNGCYLKALNTYLNSIQKIFSYNDIHFVGNLIVSPFNYYKRVFTYPKLININLNGQPEPDFKPKNVIEKNIQKNTVEFLNEVNKYGCYDNK